VIAVDTNVLVYAFYARAPQHRAAVALVRGLAEGAKPWGVPWPCVPEFLRVVTDRRFARPAAPAVAWGFLDLLFGSPSGRRLLPTDDSLRRLRDVMNESGAAGVDLHDAHIFALCLEHGVRELLTADRGFRRFRGLKVTDPFD
jgi:toxin-antitoxin system PIN domain toxin